MICVLYDMLLLDLKEAADILEEDDRQYEKANDCLRHATQVLEHLKYALDFSQGADISANLFSLYDYCQRLIARAMYMKSMLPITEVVNVVEPLSEAFCEVATTDHSAPMMQHAQQVVTGYTYGRGDVNEAMNEYDSNRGFLV